MGKSLVGGVLIFSRLSFGWVVSFWSSHARALVVGRPRPVRPGQTKQKIRRDKEIAQTFNDLRRSRAFTQIASLKGRGLLTEDEFLRFSQDTRDSVDLLLGDLRM